MPDKTAIDRLFEESTELTKALQVTPELSLQVAAGDCFRKALLLAAASYFEHRVCSEVLDFVRERSGGSVLVESFVRNKAISRQYHSWFEWEGNNANKFFSLFGTGFRSAMGERIRESASLRSAIKAFLEIGNERNKLVHQDYATFALEKTLDEVYQLYQAALPFINSLSTVFRECDGPADGAENAPSDAPAVAIDPEVAGA